MARTDSDTLTNIRELWSAASWQLATDMRGTVSFHDSTYAILASQALTQRHMRLATTSPRKRKQEAHPTIQYKDKIGRKESKATKKQTST